MKDVFARAIITGSVAAAAVTIVTALASRRAVGTYPAAMNATSHVLWGQDAANQDDFSWKYTGIGLTANYGASVFWALLYEALAPRRHESTACEAAARGAAVSAVAYLTDYHLIPRRFTPGFELRLSRRALALTYGLFAVGLSLTDLLRRLPNRPLNQRTNATD